ncbi:hypothetical protein DFH06DRAFT_7065 [Mycena polygramma]|nr:hypothetical protein DFH06DRAFT_7065 [Mycena polygramma]
MAVVLSEVHRKSVENFLEKHRDLADRISLTLEFHSDIEETTLKALQDELEILKERTERPQNQGLLGNHGVLNALRDGFVVMTVQLNSQRAKLDPDYEPDFPAGLSDSVPRGSASTGQPAPRAVASLADRGEGSSRIVTGAQHRSATNTGREPASGPQRRTSSTREHREQVNSAPTHRSRLSDSLPSDCEVLDVVFLPFRSDRTIHLPDVASQNAQLCLNRLGLVFPVRLPRQGLVWDYLDDAVQSFCEVRKIDLRPGQEKGAAAWTPMVIRKKKNCPLEVELPVPTQLTLEELTSKPFDMKNFVPHSRRKVLFIAPVYADLTGAINLPDVDTPQMKHHCHVSRLIVAINIKKEKGLIARCDSKCPAVNTTIASSSRHGTGRTLA